LVAHNSWTHQEKLGRELRREGKKGHHEGKKGYREGKKVITDDPYAGVG
jgi:hypothetical protein